eukprot:INCI14569.1.p1 GENE.INCI14569.1~~INCI14569.1.p1  ORF type:complete len:2081 (-),score=332.28 INCI14569.1:376-6132(-)
MGRDYSDGTPVEAGTSHPAVVVSSYPVPTKRHSRLDFEEKCLSIGQFLFPYQLRCVTREELHRDSSLGTTAEPYSFMFVGTDSDYSKFYAHCCVVHVPVEGSPDIFEPVALVAMTFQPTHCSLRRVLESKVRGSSPERIAAFRKPSPIPVPKGGEVSGEGNDALRGVFEAFLPTIRRYRGFTWVISHRDLLALKSSTPGTKLTQEEKLPLYKCLFTNHTIDSNQVPMSFAGPVIHLDALLGFIATNLLQRKGGAAVTVPRLLRASNTTDPYEKSILLEQVELCLLFANPRAAEAVKEFGSNTLIQAMIEACQDENAPTILGDTLLPTDVEPHRPKPDPPLYQHLLQRFALSAADTIGAACTASFTACALALAGDPGDTTERRQILAEYVERDIGRRVALQVKSIGAVLLAAADASASTLAKEFAEPVSGPAAPVERLLTALYEALAPAINEKKNPVATLLLQLQMRLDRNPGAVSRTLGEKLIEHIQFHQALPVDFASGDWALRETLKAAKELVNEEAGMARYAGMSAIATLASKYEKGSLSEVDFKAQLLHLEVCPVLADVVRRLLFNNGPIVLPVTLAAAAVAFKDVDPVSAKRCEELDSAVVTFFRSPGLPPSSRRLLHLYLRILHLGIEECGTATMRQECADLSQIHASWLAESMLDSPRHIQRRVVGAGCFDDSPPGLRFAFAMQQYRHSPKSSPIASAEAVPGSPGTAASFSEATLGVEFDSRHEHDFTPAVRRAVTAFMAYVLRHLSSLRTGGFLDFASAADDVDAGDTPNSTVSAPSELTAAMPDAINETAGPTLTTANLEMSSSPVAAEAGSTMEPSGENPGEATEATAETQVSSENLEMPGGLSLEAATVAPAVEHPRAAASVGIVDPDTRARLENDLRDFVHLSCVSILASALARQVLRSSWDILPSMLPSSTRDAIFRPNLLKYFGAIDSMAIGVKGIRAKMLSTSSHFAPRNRPGGFGSGGNFGESSQNSQIQSGIQHVFAGKTLIYYPALNAIFDYLHHALEYTPLDEVNKIWFLGQAPDADNVLVGGSNNLPALRKACDIFGSLCKEVCLLLAADPRKDISEALEEAGPVTAIAVLLALCSGTLPKWYLQGSGLQGLRGNFKRSIIPSDLLRFCCPDKFQEPATKQQLKKFPSVFGASSKTVSSPASSNAFLSSSASVAGLSSDGTSPGISAAALNADFESVRALNSTLKESNGGHGPLTDCFFSYTPPQTGSKDASKACLYSKVVLRRLVEVIARLDLQAALSQEELVEVLCSCVPALVEADISSVNESLAVAFMFHLVREFQAECAGAQFLLQEITHLSGPAAEKLRMNETGNASPAATPSSRMPKIKSMLGNYQSFCPAPLEPFDVEYQALFSRLSPDVLTILVSALLTETSIVLLASDPQPLTDVFEAAQALVAPYEWQCFYIPIVREDMMDAMLGAPFPKMLGWVKTKQIENPVLEFSDVGYSGILIDLDTGALHSYPDEPQPRPVPNSTFTVQRVPETVMPCLPDRFGLRVFQDLMGITLGGTLRTVALENSSDAEAVAFLQRTEASRFKEVQWTFTSVLVSLFKNLRQHIAANAEGKTKFNQSAFLASFREDHQGLMTKIVESQAFECFKASLMTHAGGPFDWWCYTKVKMLRDRYVGKKSKKLNGFLWKAPRGTAPSSTKKSAFKLRYFELGFGVGGKDAKHAAGANRRASSQDHDAVEYLHYYELTPSLKHVYELGMKYVFASAEESASSGSGGGGKGGKYSSDFQSRKWAYETAMQKYLQHGIHAFEAQGAPGVLHGAGRAGPSVDAKKFHKGSFILERGNGRVSIPQSLANNVANTPTQFPFVITNTGGANEAGRKKTDSVVVLCAPSNDNRRKWMEYLKSHMVDDAFMTKLEESYTKAKDFIVDESLQAEIDKGRRERAAWAEKKVGSTIR